MVSISTRASPPRSLDRSSDKLNRYNVDVPRSEIYFADTYDKVGPLGAKAQGECGINAVAPAIANAVANATGVRFPDLPLTPDRIFAKLGARS